jgi:hypothetical protein
MRMEDETVVESENEMEIENKIGIVRSGGIKMTIKTETSVVCKQTARLASPVPRCVRHVHSGHRLK